MNNQDKFSYNFFAALHNLGLTAKAEQLINNFIGDGSETKLSAEKLLFIK